MNGQQTKWPFWTYDLKRLLPLLALVNQAQGRLQGRMQGLGIQARDHATFQVLTEDVIKSSEIEGENLNADKVRSSLARRLGLDIGALAPPTGETMHTAQCKLFQDHYTARKYTTKHPQQLGSTPK